MGELPSHECFRAQQDVGAVLTALLIIFGGKTILDIVYKHKSAKAGLDAADAQGGGQAPAEAPERRSISPGDRPATQGQRRGREGHLPQCLPATLPTRVGPRSPAPISMASSAVRAPTHAGFAYSAAMKGKGGSGTFEETGQLPAQPEGGHSEQQDGIPRCQGQRRARRSAGLPAQVGRQSGAATVRQCCSAALTGRRSPHSSD